MRYFLVLILFLFSCSPIVTVTVPEQLLEQLSGTLHAQNRQINKLRDSISTRENKMRNQYYEGMIEGVRRFAWWKDGTQYVGSCGTTLQSAIDEIRKEQEEDSEANNDREIEEIFQDDDDKNLNQRED
mgnify:CR=1 FL=1